MFSRKGEKRRMGGVVNSDQKATRENKLTDESTKVRKRKENARNNLLSLGRTLVSQVPRK